MSLSKEILADLGVSEPEAEQLSKDTQMDGLAADLAALARAAETTEDREVVRAVREEQMLVALQHIRANTERRSWRFPVVRDAEGRITSLRAIPEAAASLGDATAPER